MSRERDLKNAGYVFTGEFAQGSEGKAKMKAAAKAWRDKGYLATVVLVIGVRSDGYSVYRKDKRIPAASLPSKESK